MMKKVVLAASAAAFLAGCTTNPFTGEPQVSRTAGGAAIGALAGAGVGMLVGGYSDRTNALIGAGVGALAGGAVGSYMDSQEAELRGFLQGTGVSVTRQGDNIILNMPSNVTFATDEYQVTPNFFQTLNAVALVLNKYNQTLVDVNGHTDSTGSLQHNQALSERRAQSVATYLVSQSVDQRRLLVQGFGPSQPVASNSTPEGRALNRRVEIILVPITR